MRCSGIEQVQAGQTEVCGHKHGVGMGVGKWLRGKKHLPYMPKDLTLESLNGKNQTWQCRCLQT